MKIYQSITAAIPDEVFFNTSRECLRTLRFFPTPSEFLEKSQPILQEYTLKHRQQIEEKIIVKCEENVTWVEDGNYPVCKLEEPKRCELAGTGRCKKWHVQRP